MKARATNIGLYWEWVKELIAQLDALEKQGKLLFIGGESLARMKQLHESWWRGYQEVVVVMRSEGWRSDIPLLKYRLDPLFKQARFRLDELQDKLRADSEGDISNLTLTAERLSNFLGLLAAGGLLLVVIGFLVFQRTVLAPVASVARALKAEAKGHRHVEMRHSNAEEITNLADAFKEMRDQVSMRQQRLQDVLDNAAEAIITVDQRGMVESFNAAAEDLFGYRVHEVVGRGVEVLLPRRKQARRAAAVRRYLGYFVHSLLGAERELFARRKDGRLVPVSLKVSRSIIRGKPIYTGLVVDISERKAILQRLQTMAERDPLTGLVNRVLFQDRLAHAVARAERTGKFVAVLFLDLNDFKGINDTRGHHAGDELLKEVARRVSDKVREGDTVARLGGDEFTVVLEGITSHEQVVLVTRKIIGEFARPFRLDRRELLVSASVGVAVYPFDGKDVETLVRNADTAMYRAKSAGANQCQFYSTEQLGH
jgi:diguanylate cyclase (GGDEF)-like protein/PAS domain S-box-containing protein